MALDDVGDDLLAEQVKVLLFPHEKGVVGGELIQQQGDEVVVLGLKHVVYKFGKAFVSPLLQGSGQATGDQLPLLGQVDAVVALDELHQPAKVAVGDGQGGK